MALQITIKNQAIGAAKAHIDVMGTDHCDALELLEEHVLDPGQQVTVDLPDNATLSVIEHAAEER